MLPIAPRRNQSFEFDWEKMAETEPGPLDMEDTFNIIHRNLDNSSDVLALASTSKTMASRAAGQLSSIHVPLFKRLLVTEEQSEKAEMYRTILKEKTRKRFLGWYWSLLDSRFLSLYNLTRHWMKPYESSLPEFKVTRTVNQNLNSIAFMLITYTSKSSRLSPEFFKASRRFVTGERLSYKELSETTISLFQLFRPNLLAFLPTGAKEEFQGLLTAFQLAGKGETSRYFNDLVETRLAYICAVVFSIKRAFASNPSGEFDNRRNEFAYLTSFLRLCLSDTEIFSTLATQCQLFAQQVEQANQRVAISILEWRFGKQFIKDAEIAKTGSLQEPETVTSLEIATEFVTRPAQSVVAIQLRDLNVVSAFFLVRVHCCLFVCVCVFFFG